jgi:inosose dehydratase
MTKPEYRIANAPCSWGILDFDPTHQIGFAKLLDEISATGYVGTELGAWGFMPTDPTNLDSELKQRALSMVGAFVQVTLTDETAHASGEETAVRTAALLAAVHRLQPDAPPPPLVLSDTIGGNPMRSQRAGRIRPEDGLKPEQWDVFAKGANRIAATVRERTGVRTVFHHHCAGFVETPGEVSALMDRTDPKLLGLCLDTGHYTVGGGDKLGDPLEALKRYGDRVWHVHFKDCQPSVAEIRDPGGKITGHRPYSEAVSNDLFCELGKGVVAFPALLAELDRRAYKGWIVVEQDILPGAGDPKASAGRNREYLKSLGR